MAPLFPATDTTRNKNGFMSGSLFTHLGGDVGISNSWRAGLSYLATQPSDRAWDDGRLAEAYRALAERPAPAKLTEATLAATALAPDRKRRRLPAGRRPATPAMSREARLKQISRHREWQPRCRRIENPRSCSPAQKTTIYRSGIWRDRARMRRCLRAGSMSRRLQTNQYSSGHRPRLDASK